MSLAPLLSLLSAFPPAPQDSAQVTLGRAWAAMSEALPLVERKLGFDLPDDFELRATGRAEMVRILADDLRPFVPPRPGNPLAREDEIREAAEAHVAGLLAKYSPTRRLILISPENVASCATRFGLPELCSDVALRAILAHELVHAVDEPKYGLQKILEQVDAEKRAGLAGVIEGHAQFVAREICAEQGWTDGFEAMTSTLGMVPRSLLLEREPLLRILAEVDDADHRTRYLQGERFVAALHAAGGEELIRRAFTRPPSGLSSLFHPDWFEHPASRPRLAFDLEAALDVIADRFAKPGWTESRKSGSSQEESAWMIGLGDEERARLAALFRASRQIVLSPPGDTGQSVFLSASAHDTPEDARTDAAASLELLRSIDETLDRGLGRVVESRYERLHAEGLDGFQFEKKTAVGPLVVPFRGILLTRGALIVCVGFNAAPVEQDELRGLAREALEAIERAADRKPLELSFEGTPVGDRPAGWKIVKIGVGGPLATWAVAADASAPTGATVLRVQPPRAEESFHFLLSEERWPADIEASVRLRADGGEQDRGGGLVWRARGPLDHYMAVWDPLDDRVRVYAVLRGARRVLASGEVEGSGGPWHELAVAMQGTGIAVSFDGEVVVRAADASLEGGGKVGLCSRGDAATSFDDLSVRPLRK